MLLWCFLGVVNCFLIFFFMCCIGLFFLTLSLRVRVFFFSSIRWCLLCLEMCFWWWWCCYLVCKCVCDCWKFLCWVLCVGCCVGEWFWVWFWNVLVVFWFWCVCCWCVLIVFWWCVRVSGDDGLMFEMCLYGVCVGCCGDVIWRDELCGDGCVEEGVIYKCVVKWWVCCIYLWCCFLFCVFVVGYVWGCLCMIVWCCVRCRWIRRCERRLRSIVRCWLCRWVFVMFWWWWKYIF